MKAERLWTGAILGLAVLALASSLHLGLSLRRDREIVKRKEADLGRIRGHAGRWAREEAFRARLEQIRAEQPVDLEEIAVRTLGSGVARLSPRPAESVDRGWQRREMTVEIREAPYAEAALFLAAAAETPPAWRMREIDLRASATAGQGAMTVVLEALEKKRP